MTEQDLIDNAAEHLKQVGPVRQIIEAIEGLIDGAIDDHIVKGGGTCSCDPELIKDYARECLRQALSTQPSAHISAYPIGTVLYLDKTKVKVRSIQILANNHVMYEVVYINKSDRKIEWVEEFEVAATPPEDKAKIGFRSV